MFGKLHSEVQRRALETNFDSGSGKEMLFDLRSDNAEEEELLRGETTGSKIGGEMGIKWDSGDGPYGHELQLVDLFSRWKPYGHELQLVDVISRCSEG